MPWAESADDRLRAAVDAMQHPDGAGVGVIDAGRTFAAIDDRLAGWLGTTADRVCGLALASVGFLGCDVDGAILTAETHPGAVALRTGEPVLGSLAGFEPRGDDVQPFRWFSVDAWPVDVEGERIGAVLHVHDVSHGDDGAIATSRVMRSYRTVVAALQEEQARFRALAENAADVVYQTDLDSRCACGCRPLSCSTSAGTRPRSSAAAWSSSCTPTTWPRRRSAAAWRSSTPRTTAVSSCATAPATAAGAG